MRHRFAGRGDQALAVGQVRPTAGGGLPDPLRLPPARAILIPGNVQTSTPRGRSPLPVLPRQLPRQEPP